MVLCKWLDNTGLDELELVGGKNASIGEMIKNLSSRDILVPFGFIVTSKAFDLFLEYNNLNNRIDDIIQSIDVDDLCNLKHNGLKIREMILSGTMPELLEITITEYYNNLSLKYLEENTDVAVRSSGTSEDLPDASFAGQQDTYLNIRGVILLIHKIKSCFASLYTDRAISYRKMMNFKNTIKLSVCIQKMVRSDIGSSGVAFSIDPDTGFRDVVIINGSWGLGEMVVSGKVKPDEFIVFKNLANYPIIDKNLGQKHSKMIYHDDPNENTQIVDTNMDQFNNFCLDDENIVLLAKWVHVIEKYYSDLYERWCPVDIEWALDGLTHKLYIVQARPETIHSRKADKIEFIEYSLEKTEKTEILCFGIAVGSSISCGNVKLITSIDCKESYEFKEGDVLVSKYTDPTFEPLMKKASAIITDSGGRTSHAAIVSRELGKTAIVGCNNATTILQKNQYITVSCSEGEIGYVYSGGIPYIVKKTDFTSLPHLDNIHSKLMLNIGNPNNVFKFYNYPIEGVGLAREEFIIANSIGIHPLSILYPEKTSDEIKNIITVKSLGYETPVDFYVKKLAYGIAKIGATFYPKPVIVRFSDFKSNEYRDLLGGNIFEPCEENPMIGFRGCSRYYSEFFKPAFKLECDAIKYVREIMGLDNVIVMLPFCRTVEECKLTIETMKEFGLERHKNQLKIYLMCEIPSNAILADDFCQYVDGFSIGSNDLTQLCLGIDRDAGHLSYIGNETNLAVKKLIQMAIHSCKKNNIKIGICGQGPSDIFEFAEFLVKEEIDTISLVPDSIFKTHINLSKL